MDGYDYDLIIIAVKGASDPAGVAPARRSIGGFFTPIKKVDSAGTAITPDMQPATLPNTGEVAPVHKTSSQRRMLGMLLIGGGIVVAIATVRRRRSE
jgi:hypothetical protein